MIRLILRQSICCVNSGVTTEAHLLRSKHRRILFVCSVSIPDNALTTTPNFQVDYIAGGAGQNSVRVAQWMLSGAGQPAGTGAYFGAIGADA